MIIGMDFGTTNSGMAVYDGRSVNILPLDPGNRNPRVARTALYITNDHSISIGRGAVDQYFAQNIGRAVKMQKVWLGELEVYGADMYYVTDAYAWIDVYSPGRLFLSVKTGLRNADYAGTVVGQYYYALEDLISLYMSVTKTRAEQQLGQELRQVVLGRPVRFATDPEHDQLAQARLLQAAFHAGYEKVYLQYEPIAAAFSYETEIDHEQNVLVFDFGGGTLDVTVMRLGNPKTRQVLSTGGIPVAGDVFDQKIVQAKLTRHFGKGSEYGPRHKAMTVPQGSTSGSCTAKSRPRSWRAWWRTRWGTWRWAMRSGGASTSPARTRSGWRWQPCSAASYVLIANGLAQMLAAKLSRQDEFEADAYAAALMMKAGFGTGPQVRLLEKLQHMAGVGGGAPVWLTRHPRTGDRIAAIRALEHGWRPADR
jgi:hypothetical protein